MRNRILIGLVVAMCAGAGLVRATPGFLSMTTQLARATTHDPIKIKTKLKEPSDIYVQTIKIEPGGYSGWHSHSGPGVVAVKAGVATLYDGDDPSCTPRYVSAGDGFVENLGHVHFVRNEGSVPYEAVATFVLPVGAPNRVDAPSPGNCGF